MNKLAKFISDRTGIDQKLAMQVAEAVVDYLKKNLPAPLNAHVDKLVAGDISDISQIPGLGKGGLGGLFSGLFGKKK